MNGETFDIRYPGDRDLARDMRQVVASLLPVEWALMEKAALEAQKAGYSHVLKRQIHGFNFGFTANGETGRAAVFSFDRFPAHFLKPA